MGFELLGGLLVVLGIAFLALGALFLGRKLFKKRPEDEGVGASRELSPHEHELGRGAPSDAENPQTRV